MSGTRFDKWRALAIAAVENDLRERDFALARWGDDVRTGSIHQHHAISGPRPPRDPLGQTTDLVPKLLVGQLESRQVGANEDVREIVGPLPRPPVE